VDFAKLSDINVLASLLKMFLKCLPESLIPSSLTDLLAALLDIPEEAEKIKYLAWMLQNYVPDPNYATLKYIGQCLHPAPICFPFLLTRTLLCFLDSWVSLKCGGVLTAQ